MENRLSASFAANILAAKTPSDVALEMISRPNCHLDLDIGGRFVPQKWYGPDPLVRELPNPNY